MIAWERERQLAAPAEKRGRTRVRGLDVEATEDCRAVLAQVLVMRDTKVRGERDHGGRLDLGEDADGFTAQPAEGHESGHVREV
jgi:hypothetical protein